MIVNVTTVLYFEDKPVVIDRILNVLKMIYMMTPLGKNVRKVVKRKVNKEPTNSRRNMNLIRNSYSRDTRNTRGSCANKVW